MAERGERFRRLRMSEEVPAFDELNRGHVVLAPDPFKTEEDASRPWVVVNNESHPFDKEQYIVMGLTTRTWYDERIPIEEEEYIHRQAPEGSSIIPHSVASLKPELMTDYVCHIGERPLNEAVETLVDYL